MFRWLATIALVAAAVRPVSGQERKDTALAAARESRPAAMAGLDTLRTLAREHYATLGFSDPEQAAGASLGEPLVEFFVRLDSLQAFSNAKKAASLLSGGDKVMYPVLAGDRDPFLHRGRAGKGRLAPGRLRRLHPGGGHHPAAGSIGGHQPPIARASSSWSASRHWASSSSGRIRPARRC